MWVELVANANYEINTDWPHQIRRKRDRRIIKESKNKGGYLCVHLNGDTYYKHRIVAMQFMPNQNGLPCVDHRNHNRTDFRLENLRWVTVEENNKNRKDRIYSLDDCPDDLVVVEGYEAMYYSPKLDINLIYDEQKKILKSCTP